MHTTVKLWVLFLAALAIHAVRPAQIFAASQTPSVRKDPAALAALVQMSAATGWAVGSLPADAVITAIVTPAGQSSSNATLKLRGLSQFRVDTQFGTGMRTLVVNNGQSSLIQPDGTTQSLPVQDAISIWPVDVPAFSDLPLAAASPTISITSLGMEVASGVSCNKLQLTTLVDPNSPLAAITSEVGSIVLWLDANSGLPVQVQYIRIASDNSAATVVHTRTFSNYQSVNGMQFAFAQQEFVSGQLRFTLQLSSVALNVGLTDADFPLAGAQQGGF